jgi:hypothetical protein
MARPAGRLERSLYLLEFDIFYLLIGELAEHPLSSLQTYNQDVAYGRTRDGGDF